MDIFQRAANELMNRADKELVEYMDMLNEQVQNDRGLCRINKMRLTECFEQIKQAVKQSTEESLGGRKND